MSNKKSRDDLLNEEYLGDLHHDLKNQIASIKAFNQLILRKTTNEDVVDYANSIENRTNTLLEMMNNFFDGLRKNN